MAVHEGCSAAVMHKHRHRGVTPGQYMQLAELCGRGERHGALEVVEFHEGVVLYLQGEKGKLLHPRTETGASA